MTISRYIIIYQLSVIQNLEKMNISRDAKINHIAILIAMESEATPYVTAMNLQKIDSECPQLSCSIYQGEFHGGKVSVIVNGKDKRYNVDCVGTTPGMTEDSFNT